MRQFLRTLKDIKKYIRRGPAPDVIKVCPICLGADLEVMLNSFLGLLSPPYYICRICGYKGPIFAEIERIQYESLISINEGNSFSGG